MCFIFNLRSISQAGRRGFDPRSRKAAIDMRPNLNAMYRLIESWSGGTLGNDQVFRPPRTINVSTTLRSRVRIGAHWGIQVENRTEDILRIVQRIGIRVTAITDHLNIPLPDELNPRMLFEDLRSLADAGNKIRATYVHRRRTGCGLVEAKRVIDE